MIVVDDLHKSFSDIKAVQGVSFTASDGKVTGLLGPNGAGKSTTLRILYTVLKPDAGSATIDDVNVVDDGLAARARIGTLPHGVHSHFLTAIGGHQNANGRFAERLGALDQVQPADAWHAEVREQHVVSVFLQQAQRALAVFRNVHIVTILQRRTQSLARRFLVIDN